MAAATPGDMGRSRRVSAYGWYALLVLVLVYVINFVDRQIISILAQDIKHDLHLRDAQIGFLYGTAFAVFYALFGIPLGRLADSWYRGRLIALGLGLWSAMTALSGFASSFAMLATARIGVGIGEASASPAAYSMISDYFPQEKRATALSIYSAGLYVGGGLSLPVGGLISSGWTRAWPHAADAPLGLAGWQAAFLAVGIPGPAARSVGADPARAAARRVGRIAATRDPAQRLAQLRPRADRHHPALHPVQHRLHPRGVPDQCRRARRHCLRSRPR